MSTVNYLLVLGCRVRGREPEPMLKMRIEAAADYLLANPDTLCIPCGGIVHKDQLISEAQAISEGLKELGVERERIVLEDKSKTTFENFLNAKTIIEAACKEKKQEAKITFLSSDFHLKRASIIAKSCGVVAQCIPAPSPKNQLLLNVLREILCFPLLAVEITQNRIRPRS